MGTKTSATDRFNLVFKVVEWSGMTLIKFIALFVLSEAELLCVVFRRVNGVDGGVSSFSRLAQRRRDDVHR